MKTDIMTVEIGFNMYEAEYIVHPAEPDVGVSRAYVEVKRIEGLESWGEDIFDFAEAYIERELGIR